MADKKAIDSAINGLTSNNPDVEGAALIGSDGLMIASALKNGLDSERIAAMSAALLSMGVRASQMMEMGGFAEMTVRGDEQLNTLYSVGETAVLSVLAGSSANLGLINIESRSAVRDLTAALD